jgi:hypothetical protein
MLQLLLPGMAGMHTEEGLQVQEVCSSSWHGSGPGMQRQATVAWTHQGLASATVALHAFCSLVMALMLPPLSPTVPTASSALRARGTWGRAQRHRVCARAAVTRTLLFIAVRVQITACCTQGAQWHSLAE